VHHIALLEPGCSCISTLYSFSDSQIVPKLTRYYDGIVIAPNGCVVGAVTREPEYFIKK